MIKLTHKFSEIDKRHEFGLKTNIVYDNWIWFYLGRELNEHVYLYPYPNGKVIMNCKTSGNAKTDAKKIVRKIFKVLNSK